MMYVVRTVCLAFSLEAVYVHERVFGEFQAPREQTEDWVEDIEMVVLRKRADLRKNWLQCLGVFLKLVDRAMNC